MTASAELSLLVKGAGLTGGPPSCLSPGHAGERGGFCDLTSLGKQCARTRRVLILAFLVPLPPRRCPFRPDPWHSVGHWFPSRKPVNVGPDLVAQAARFVSVPWPGALLALPAPREGWLGCSGRPGPRGPRCRAPSVCTTQSRGRPPSRGPRQGGRPGVAATLQLLLPPCSLDGGGRSKPHPDFLSRLPQCSACFITRRLCCQSWRRAGTWGPFPGARTGTWTNVSSNRGSPRGETYLHACAAGES